ncbi:MAG: hypothetical protein HPY82_02965 [Gammaproteobacteria bacterium]|nr:hypothetical protein [Gammaproteobacteria bacterium]
MKDLQKKLLTLVGEKISAYGFQKKPVGQSFLKAISGGRVSFHLSFIEHEADFDITVDIAIRFDDLENLINADNRLLTKKEKDLTYSFGIDIGNLANDEQKRWCVASDADIPNVADDLLADFKRYAFPYFDKYSVMSAAFELLSGNDRAAWMHSPLHGARSKRALGLAVLLGHKELVARMVEDSAAFLREVKDFGLQDYLIFSKKFLGS